MTTMSSVMRAAGFCDKFVNLFDSAGIIPVNIYDEDHELHQEDELHFIKPLFDENPGAFDQFFNLMDEINTNPDYLSIDIQITPEYVIVFYRTAKPRVFRRTATLLDPLDYAD